MIKLALFASGNGTNVQQITEHFLERSQSLKTNSKEPQIDIIVDCVVYNRKDAYVATRAQNLGIEAFYMNKSQFNNSDEVLNLLHKRKVDYIILAGFLLLVPQNLLDAYSGKIINIHPALLPKYGGKGMYGHLVHEAVVAHHEPVTGITIHLVDNQFDHGTTLFQTQCEVAPNDTADDVAAKIHLLEKEYFPLIIEKFVTNTL